MEFRWTFRAGRTVQAATLTVRAGPSQSASPTGAMQVRAYDVDSAAPFVEGHLGDPRTHSIR